MVDVAVFDGEKFTALGGKEVAKGQVVNTIWGWLAWQIGPKAFEIFKKHDHDRVAPHFQKPYGHLLIDQAILGKQDAEWANGGRRIRGWEVRR